MSLKEQVQFVSVLYSFFKDFEELGKPKILTMDLYHTSLIKTLFRAYFETSRENFKKREPSVHCIFFMMRVKSHPLQFVHSIELSGHMI
jgi:hypothetical protein